VLRLSLRYSKGRSHDFDYHGPERFHVGQEFELYGRRWGVSAITPPRSSRFGESCRVVSCVPLTGSALPRSEPR
jgi:hypothetical protein